MSNYYCKHPGCESVLSDGRLYCDKHAAGTTCEVGEPGPMGPDGGGSIHHYCAYHGCSVAVPIEEKYCDQHAGEKDMESSPWQKWRDAEYNNMPEDELRTKIRKSIDNTEFIAPIGTPCGGGADNEWRLADTKPKIPGRYEVQINSDTFIGAYSTAYWNADGTWSKPGVYSWRHLEDGIKHDAGKLRMDLIPPEAINALAEVLTYGVDKYGERNWERGIQYSRIFAAVQRHLWAWWGGSGSDEESGIHHLHHALCGLAFLAAFNARDKLELDDRPNSGARGSRNGE